MEDWKYGPPVLIGERVVWLKNSAEHREGGIVRWIGKLSREAADWTVGIETDNALPFGGTDGSWGDRKLFHCDSGRGVFLPLSRIQKEVSKHATENPDDKQKSLERLEGRKGQREERENNGKGNKAEAKGTRRTSLSELPKWINNFNGKPNKESVAQKDLNGSSDTDDLKSSVQSIRKSVRRRKRRTKSPRAQAHPEKEDNFSSQRKNEIKRPFSVSDRAQSSSDGKDKVSKKHESCALEAKYIREFIQREIRKQQNSLRGLPKRGAAAGEEGKEEKMNDIRGNFKRIDEDDINSCDVSRGDRYQCKTAKKYERAQSKVLRRSDAFHRREKSNGFFSFLKWFRKSKEMPELEGMKDSSVASSPLFIRRRSSSCGSVDTLFSIATANSFAFVSPVQYQAVVSSSHTAYPTPIDGRRSEDDSKSKNQSDYENSPPPCGDSDKVAGDRSNTEKKKKCKAPKPPCLVRDISLPNTLEHRKSKEEGLDAKGFHRRSVSESFKDKKAGFYCHVQGKRKAPLPPATAPLYPSLTSLKSQCPSISKKKRPAPQPPEGRDHVIMNKLNGTAGEERGEGTANLTGNKQGTPNYDNVQFSISKSNNPPQSNGSLTAEKETPKLKGINLSPLLGLSSDISSSPLPSRPWYKRNSSGSSAPKKDSMRLLDKKKNKETEDWMPEVGFSRRPISRECGPNLFNLLSRLDKNQDKRKEDKRKSQISILANISELDREAAEIVRKEQAQEKKMMEDNDEKYYSTIFNNNNNNNNALSAFPNIRDRAPKSREEVPRPAGSPKMGGKNPFDEFKPKTESERVKGADMNNSFFAESEKSQMEAKEEEEEEDAVKIRNEEYANAELDYYINPWNCPECTLENPGWEKFCEACNTMRVKFHEMRAKTESHLGETIAAVGQTDKAREGSKSNATEAKPKAAGSRGGSASLPTEEPEDPAEDNLEGVRRKRLAFFTSRQSSLRDSTTASSPDEMDERMKLKKMLKEMKDSLPKHEKGVINNATESKAKDDPDRAENALGDFILGCRDKISGDAGAAASAGEFFNAKVQQTRRASASEASKRGDAQMTKPCEPGRTTAEAIVITKTTIFEDVIVRRDDGEEEKMKKKKKAARTDGCGKRLGQGSRGRSPDTDHAYANVKDVGVWDLTLPDATFTDGDIEAMTAKLREEGAGSGGYKVDIRASAATSETNTLNVNRLLKKLESAINSGKHSEAGSIAGELARMKVGCSVRRQKLALDAVSPKITVDLYVEDKLTHKGPIQVAILPNTTLGQLKAKVEKEWDIPRNVQRWILGRQLATEDGKTLEEHGVVSDSCPLFLYIVTTDQNHDEQSESLKGIRNVPESVRTDRRTSGSGRAPEARRPSLIVEVDENGGESAGSEAGNRKADRAAEKRTPEAVGDAREGGDSTEKQSPDTKREAFQRRSSQSSSSFEKREMSEVLKKELKVISTNSVKDKIERLNRAATGSTTEPSETYRSGWKCKSDDKAEVSKNAAEKWHYNELIELENADIVANVEEFECPVCMVEYKRGEGVVLRDCLHTFCRSCLVNTIQFNEEAEVKCPYRDDNYSCESVLQQREIKSLVPKGIFEQHLAKSVSVAENNIGNAYHCKTPDCKGWCILEDNVNEFRCPVCKKVNCLTCQSIHTGMNCRQYQEQIQFTSDTNAESKKTKDMLQEMVEKGEAMACPTCQVVLMKKWGCDWLRCSMCKTEICWVTRGPRWGPGGKGDNSGGCQCGVNGIKCHPKCNYCH